jgi:hypothetical protein
MGKHYVKAPQEAISIEKRGSVVQTPIRSSKVSPKANLIGAKVMPGENK